SRRRPRASGLVSIAVKSLSRHPSPSCFFVSFVVNLFSPPRTRSDTKRRSLLGDSGQAHALENALALREIGGVVAEDALAAATDGEFRRACERGPGLDARLLDPAKERERRRNLELRDRIGPVQIHGFSQPPEGLLVAAEHETGDSEKLAPDVRDGIARAQPHRLGNSASASSARPGAIFAKPMCAWAKTRFGSSDSACFSSSIARSARPVRKRTSPKQ